jgi:hypothetical protein
MDPTVTTALQSLLTAVVLAVVALLTYAVKKGVSLGQMYLEQKLGSATFGFIKDYVNTTVRFLEQTPIFQDLTGPEKKEKAVTEVVIWCQEHSLPVDHDLIDKLIEEAVNVMNSVGQPPMFTMEAAPLVSEIGK